MQNLSERASKHLWLAISKAGVEAVTACESGNLTINGVVFRHRNGITPRTTAVYSIATHISQTLANAYIHANMNPATTDDYHKLLVNYGDVTTNPGAGASITLDGLQKGTTYRVQLWTGQWDNDVYDTVYDGHSLNPDSYVPRGTPAKEVPPQFMVGTFTADGTSQTIPITAGKQGIAMYASAVSLFAAPDQHAQPRGRNPRDVIGLVKGDGLIAPIHDGVLDVEIAELVGTIRQFLPILHSWFHADRTAGGPGDAPSGD